MLDIYFELFKLIEKFSTSEKFIGGQAYTLSICNDLIGG